MDFSLDVGTIPMKEEACRSKILNKKDIYRIKSNIEQKKADVLTW